MEKNLVETFFGRKFFCCKIISSGTVWMKKILVVNYFLSKIFLLQNHFLGKSLDEKKFGRKSFWSKIFFGRIFFLLQNHFLEFWNKKICI